MIYSDSNKVFRYKDGHMKKGSAQLIIIIILVVLLLGALGFILWQNVFGKTSQTANQANIITSQTQANTNTTNNQQVATYTPTIPSGWTTHSIADFNLSYAIPSGTKLEYAKYKFSEMIDVGYGAPVRISYTQAQGWQTYDMDSNGQYTVKRNESLVKSLDAKAQNQYSSSYYNTGDGPVGESRVLVVKDTSIYQFAFTEQIETTDFMNSFVKTLDFK